MTEFQKISNEQLKNFNEYYNGNVISGITTKAVSKTKLDDVCYDLSAAKKMNYKFSLEIPTMQAPNQKSSGRCWLFAALNTLREKVAKKLNIEKFELSQNYISFYDKLEKANYFLESMIETAARPADDRLVNWLLKSPIGDGGQWDMFVGVCKKYALVPQEAMPETYQSENTSRMNWIINKKLREDAIVLRKAAAAGKPLEQIQADKNEMLKEIFNILSVCLGNPPETFDFEYVDKDKNYHIDRGLTPRAFYDKYIGVELDEYVSIINAPTPAKPFNRTYTIDHLGSAVEAAPILYLNLTMDEFKAAVIKQLQDNEIVWFGCDCGPFSERDKGIWDTAMYDYETPFGIKFNMSKGEMLDYCQSAMNHAMVITGVGIIDGKPDKWKIENSWGEEHANKGYHIMSDDWFDKYVYQACVNKKYLTKEQHKLLEQEVIVLPPWDPMGTLA